MYRSELNYGYRKTKIEMKYLSQFKILVFRLVTQDNTYKRMGKWMHNVGLIVTKIGTAYPYSLGTRGKYTTAQTVNAKQIG